MSDQDQKFEEEKDFFEKLANYAKDFYKKEDEKYNEKYEIKFAKSNHSYKLSPKQDEDQIEEDEYDGTEGQLAIDVYQTNDDFVIESAIAGVDPDDLDINVTNDSVVIRGKRKPLHEPEERDYLYQECFWGKFSRSIILPQEIDPDRATVHFKNGVLKIRLPKLNRKKVKKLKVKAE